MTTKLSNVGAAGAALILSVMSPAFVFAAEAPADAGTCFIAGWENPASVCTAHNRALASTCFNCHGPNGVSSAAIPPLAGQDKAYLVSTMKAFRSGEREATVMQKYAQGYTDSEFEDIAAYFSGLTVAGEKK